MNTIIGIIMMVCGGYIGLKMYDAFALLRRDVDSLKEVERLRNRREEAASRQNVKCSRDKKEMDALRSRIHFYETYWSVDRSEMLKLLYKRLKELEEK